MSRVRYIYKGCDFDVFAYEVRAGDDPGTPVTGATLNWTLYQSDQTTVVTSGSRTCTNTANGDYVDEGGITASVTSGLTLNATYYVKYVLSGAGTGEWWDQLVVKLQGTV